MKIKVFDPVVGQSWKQQLQDGMKQYPSSQYLLCYNERKVYFASVYWFPERAAGMTLDYDLRVT